MKKMKLSFDDGDGRKRNGETVKERKRVTSTTLSAGNPLRLQNLNFSCI